MRRRLQLLPNLLTLGNAMCGLLALSYGIDALAHAGAGEEHFYHRMESACLLIFLAMVFDALDGWVARLIGSESDLGAQLDSFSDALTFGVAPAMLAKVLVEHEGPLLGYIGSPRLHFLGAAAFAVMAILRLARYNLAAEAEAEAELEAGPNAPKREKSESSSDFEGLPSPAAAGALTSLMWLYLVLRKPELEIAEGSVTPFGRLMGWMRDYDWTPMLAWMPAALAILLPSLGLLMVSRLRYGHAIAFLTRERPVFATLVGIVFVFFLLYLAPVPVLFLSFMGYAIYGLVRGLRGARR